MLESLMYDTVLRASFLKDGDEREHGWHLKIKLSHVTGLIRWKMEGWWWGGGGLLKQVWKFKYYHNMKGCC